MSSRVKVKVSVAKKAAESVVESVMANRKRAFDKAVASNKNSFISKIFRKKWTHEQFEEYTRSCGAGDLMFHDWNMIGWGSLYEAQQVLTMCRITCEDAIYLSEDAIYHLEDHFPKEDSHE